MLTSYKDLNVQLSVYFIVHGVSLIYISLANGIRSVSENLILFFIDIEELSGVSFTNSISYSLLVTCFAVSLSLCL